MTLLAIKKLNINFGANHVVKDASLGIEKGEMVALVGESGSGKSVTALSVLQLVQGGRQSGSIVFNGTEILEAARNILRKRWSARLRRDLRPAAP